MSGKPSRKAESVNEQIALIQHQINNPLSVVLGNVQYLLFGRDQLDEKLVMRLDVIEKAALKIDQANKQLSGLINSNQEDLSHEDTVDDTELKKGHDSKERSEKVT